MANLKQQRPEGALLQRALKAKGVSGRAAAKAAGMSDARWRQIINGYQPAGAGQRVDVRGPAETIAKMAQVAGVTAEQLRDVGREDAAEALLVYVGMADEGRFRTVGSALERLRAIHDEVGAVIDELSGAEDVRDA